MKKSFYLINDPTQNVPEGDKIWVEQLKQKKIMCGRCWGIIEPAAVDIFLNEKIKKNHETC